MTRPFYNNCVGWLEEEMPALEHLIENREEITLAQFETMIDPAAWRELVEDLGYGRMGLQIEDDYHVRFYSDPKTGIPFMVHSAIEYVFAKPEEISGLLEASVDLEF